MLNINKLNNSIDELENEVAGLKSINEIYKKLDKLREEILLEKETYVQVVSQIKEVSNTLKENSINNLDTVDEFEDMITSIRKNIQEDMNLIKSDNNKLNDEIVKEYKKLNIDYLENINKLRSEYKQQFIELEKSQASLLERNKSDISVDVRQGSVEAQRTIGNFIDSKFIELQKEINRSNKEFQSIQEDKLKNVKKDIIKSMEELSIEAERKIEERYKQNDVKINKQNKLLIGLLVITMISLIININMLLK